MPIYEYQCEDAECGEKTEKLRKMAESDDPVECPKCSKPMKRMVSQSSFSLKGGGWASDGYA
jgi:putative FmdB family regulatory protein